MNQALQGNLRGKMNPETLVSDLKLNNFLSQLAGNFDYPAILKALRPGQSGAVT